MHKITLKLISTSCLTFLLTITMAGCSLVGGSDKPSKKSLVKHSVSVLKDEAGPFFDEKFLTVAFECLYDSVYDKVSADTLNKIMDTKNSKDFDKIEEEFTAKEKKAFDDAEKDCEDVTSIDSSTEE